jgi:hypothetical protein
MLWTSSEESAFRWTCVRPSSNPNRLRLSEHSQQADITAARQPSLATFTRKIDLFLSGRATDRPIIAKRDLI